MRTRTLKKLEVIYGLCIVGLVFLTLAAMRSTNVTWGELGITIAVEAAILALGGFVIYHKRRRPW